jgi:transcriptional regulator with XRE-family HTH domain
MAYDDRPAWARRLRQARISRGWSQRKLAQKLEARAGATERALPARESLVRMIRGWEAGDHLPEPFHRWLLARVLDIAEEELFEPSDGTLVMVSARGISTAQWGLLTRIAATLQRLKGDTDMERRALLRLLAGLGLGAVLPDPEPWERLSSVLKRPSSIDLATIEDLEAETVALYRREECSPAKQVFADTVSHLNLLTTLVEGAPRSSRLRRRLVVTAGETSALAGWLAHETGDQSQAECYYEAAVDAAEDAGDLALKANVLGYRSYPAPPMEAEELLEEAQTYVGDTPCLTTYAWLRGRKAEVSALARRSADALSALDDAVGAFDQAKPTEERAWTAFFDRGRLGSIEIATHARLHRGDDVQAAAAEVLRFLPPVEKRKAIVLAGVADARAELGDLEGVGQYGREALAMAVQTESSVALQQLVALGARVNGSREVQGIREFLEQLRTVQRAEPSPRSERRMR